ncbi:MAG: N-acyl homoserine lactonase family protein [Rhizomicrobium sp.]
MKVFAFTCGRITGPRGDYLAGETGTITVPVPAYLIAHAQGNVLFDTGMNVRLRQEKALLLGPLAATQEIDLPEGADIASHLARLGVAPADIRYVINSHLHYDHCGGNSFFPRATLIVHAREWYAGQRKKVQATGLYNPLDFAHMAQVCELSGETDLFGDGSVIVFPTPGHTPGHQSLRLRLDSGTIVLASDCCYLRRTLEAQHMPAHAYDWAQFRASLAAIGRLEAEGARIFYGHDPEFWQTVPQAPLPIL